jgi:hypothetical protein
MLYAGPMCLIGSKFNESEKLRPLRDTVGIQYISLSLSDTGLGVFVVYVPVVVNFEPTFLKGRNVGLLDHLAI